MTALICLARQGREVLTKHVRVFATDITPFTSSPSNIYKRHAESTPENTSWVSSLSQFQKTKVTTLSNGFRVATEVVPFAEATTIGIYIDAGSRYETDANNGVAHYLEHLIFKGTSRRTAQDIELAIESMGANLNAYTSREMTAYFARCNGKDMGKTVDILGDILKNSSLSEAAVARERSVILRESSEVNSVPDEVAFDHLHASAYQHTPLGRTILGPTQNIKTIEKSDVEAYIRTHYTAGRMVLCASGNVDHDAVVKEAEKMFADLPADSTSAEDLVAAEPSVFTGSMVAVRDPDMKSTSVIVAFKGLGWNDPDTITLQVMQQLLGSWSKGSNGAHHQRSTLSEQIATNGLADAVYAFNTNYHDTGLFGVVASTTSPEKLEDLSWVLINELAKLAYEVNPGDLQQAKNSMKSGILNASIHPTGICEEVARQTLVHGRRIPREEMFARIDLVDIAAVKSLASRLIQDQDPCISAVGELSFLPDYTWFRRRTFWNRY